MTNSSMRSIAVSMCVATLALSAGCQRQSAKSPQECVRRDAPVKVAALGYVAEPPLDDASGEARRHSDDPLGTRSPDATEREYYKEKDNTKNELRDQGKEFELPDCPPISE